MASEPQPQVDPIEEAYADLDEYSSQITHADVAYNPAALAVAHAADVLRSAYAATLAAGGQIEFVVDCPKCGEPASNGVGLFTDWEPGKPLRIDLETAASQETFTCTDADCGARCYSGDFEVFTDEDMTGGDTDDDE